MIQRHPTFYATVYYMKEDIWQIWNWTNDKKIFSGISGTFEYFSLWGRKKYPRGRVIRSPALNHHEVNILIYLRIFIFSVILSTPIHSFGEQANCFSSNWPSELSEIPPDPSIVRGKLKNGFRYVIKKNREPEERVAIYLAVQAGSLHENEDQRGVAHFLEHLMFNGSTNFPPGSLVDYFQSIGMNFGGDTNARTSHDQTVYHIILPNGSEQDLNAGFLVIADYARGALLLDSEIDRERGVILAEKRARDSAGYRARVVSTAFSFRGTRYPDRMVIGDQKILEKADSVLLRSFYDAWYRPENMIFVVVGDMEPELVEGLVEKHFSKLLPGVVATQCPDFGKLIHKGVEAFYHYEPELGKTNVSIETFWDLPLENDSMELEQRELLRFVGAMIMGYRLQRMQEKGDQPFAQARYYSGDIINRIGYGSLTAVTDAVNWQSSLSSLERTLRQALQYGFGEAEVLRAKKEILADLDAKVMTADSKNSRTIARRIIDHLNSNRVYQSAEQEKALYGPIVSNLTVEEVNRAFQTVWAHDSRQLSVTGDTRLGVGGGAEIGKIFKSSIQEPVAPPISRIDLEFPYLQTVSVPPPPPKRQIFKDIEAERLIFNNGLKVNLKKTDFTKNRFQLVVNFGGGEQKELVPGMAMLAGSIVNNSGSGKLPQTDLEALTADRSIDLSFSIRESSFAWSGTALSKDFEFFIQILHTLLFDPGIRENVFETVMANYALMYQEIEHDIEGAVPLSVQPFLAGYNNHFGMPPWEDLAGIDFGRLVEWADPLIAPQDMEISIVGDFNKDEIIKTVGKYFGSTAFSPPVIPKTSTITFPAGEQLEVTVDSSVDKSLITVAWPTEDSWDIHRTRGLHLLATIFEDRLRKVIRENLGASYSPNVSSFGSRVYKDYGFITAKMIVKPGSEDEIITEIFKASERLQEEGVTGDELLRAKNPIITSLKETISTNHYWLYSVLSLSSRHPQQLEWPKTLINDFSSISKERINELAQKYLNNKKAAIARVTPGGQIIPERPISTNTN